MHEEERSTQRFGMGDVILKTLSQNTAIEWDQYMVAIWQPSRTSERGSDAIGNGYTPLLKVVDTL